VEAIGSVLPLCDEFIIALGNSEDTTRELITSISSDKIKIIDTIWDESIREGGSVLALETDKAMDAVSSDSDWAFYIQADEVIHERYHPAIREGMEKWKDDHMVEGLLFNYLHFFGSYDFTATSRDWYRREVRIIRKDPGIRSYKDAQGFRKEGRKLKVKPLEAWVYHYGWVKAPSFQQAKMESFHKHWHDDSWMKKHIYGSGEFEYNTQSGLKKFEGTHPELMKQRIALKNWAFSPDPQKNTSPAAQRVLMGIENLTGWRIGEYKNYRLI
jgi:hypothetical protein